MSTNSTVYPKSRCVRCGKRLRRGGTKYRIHLEILSDFDGYVRGTKETLDEIAKALEEHARGKTAEELEEEVYLRIDAMLCGACRDAVVAAVRGEEGDDGS